MSNWLNMAKTNIYIHLSSCFSILCTDAHKISASLCVSPSAFFVCNVSRVIWFYFACFMLSFEAHTFCHERIIKFDCDVKREQKLRYNTEKRTMWMKLGARSLWDCSEDSCSWLFDAIWLHFVANINSQATKNSARKKSLRNYKITKKIERKEKASRKKSPINGLVVLFIKIKFTVIT